MVILYLEKDSFRTRFSFRCSATWDLNHRIFDFDMNRVQPDCLSFDTTITIVCVNNHVVDISFILKHTTAPLFLQHQLPSLHTRRSPAWSSRKIILCTRLVIKSKKEGFHNVDHDVFYIMNLRCMENPMSITPRDNNWTWSF